ncbi:MAG: hypothetical protein ABJB66_14935, partial [Gemmatimonadaceae bacterium]
VDAFFAAAIGAGAAVIQETLDVITTGDDLRWVDTDQAYANGRIHLQSLLTDVGAGRFLPTISVADCAYCDYQSVCRVSKDKYGKVVSPRAEWAKESASSNAQFEQIKLRNTSAGYSE